MFFPRLRRQAKWVFVLLALAFGGGFVLFDIGGAGTGGIGDVLFRPDGTVQGPSAEEARERIRENPKDAQAYRDLSTALQTEGKLDEAVAPLRTYVRMRPQDVDAARELAGLYLRQAESARREAEAIQAQAQADLAGLTFQPPPSSKIGQALGQDPITEAITARVNEQLNTRIGRMQTAYRNAVGVYKQIARARPSDAGIQFELAQTAELANDLPTAIAAYKKFVQLAPDDASAEAVRARIKELEAQSQAGNGAQAGG